MRQDSLFFLFLFFLLVIEREKTQGGRRKEDIYCFKGTKRQERRKIRQRSVAEKGRQERTRGREGKKREREEGEKIK